MGHFNFVLLFSNDWLYSTNRFDITFKQLKLYQLLLIVVFIQYEIYSRLKRKYGIFLMIMARICHPLR